MKNNFTFQQGLKYLSSIDSLRALYSRCKKKDEGACKMYWYLLEGRQTDKYALDFLCFDKNKLIGIVSIFFFSEIAEFSFLIHPNYRGQGVFKRLLKIAMDHIKQYGVTGYRFIVGKNCKIFSKYAKQHNGKLVHEEMVMDAPKQLASPAKQKVVLEKVGIEALELLTDMDVECFEGTDREGTLRHFASMMEVSYRQVYVAKNEAGEIVGKLHARDDYDRVCIHNVAVSKKFQQQGYGKAIMLSWLQDHQHEYQKPITIELYSHNIPALNLYLSCGFTKTAEFQCWQF